MDTKIILDTDIDTDCDDVGALAVLHALSRRGQVELLGVICSTPVQWCAPCVQAINAAYGRQDIPVGEVRVPDWETNPSHAAYRKHRDNATEHSKRALYNEVIARDFEKRATPPATREAVRLYRELLSREADGSVTICAIGTLTALAQLLQSKPHDVSPLSGRDLVAAKVRKLVTMAVVEYPKGRDEFNWVMDLPSAVEVVRDWPTPLVVSSHGATVHTGERFMAAAPATHPAAIAYRTWLGTTKASRSSWDQLATIGAANADKDLFEEKTGYTLVMDAQTGNHEWHSGAGAHDRGYLHPIVSDAVLAQRVEDLMIESLGKPA